MEKRRAAVIDGYQAILARTERMLESAHAEAWEELIAQESSYLIEVEQLKSIEEKASLDVARREVKHALLAKILDNDTQVRALLEERLARLGGLMEQSRKTQRVNQAYNVTSFKTPDSFQ